MDEKEHELLRRDDVLEWRRLVEHPDGADDVEEKPPLNVLGVDLSTKAVTAVMLTHKQTLMGWWHVEFKGKLALERCRNASEPLREIPWGDASIINFERPAGMSVKSVMDMWRVQGVILGLDDAVNPKAEVWEMVPTEWKKLAGLKGNASKERITMHAAGEMHERLEYEQEFEAAPQDFFDAYCIALAAINFNAKGEA